MKHDAHVRTAFIHFFPTKVFLAIVTFIFILGVYVGLGIKLFI